MYKQVSNRHIQSATNMDYDSEPSDPNCDHDYCGCFKITNHDIRSIRPSYIFYSVSNHTKIKNIKDYCLERAIRKLVTINSISTSIVDGYYGEEIKISCKNLNKLNNFINLLNKSSESKCVEEALCLEYGYVLDYLKNKKWYMKKVPINNIYVGDALKKVDFDTVEEYKQEEELFCLCIEDAGSFRLLDGYHRYAAAYQNNKKKINVIYCKGK